MNPIHSLSLGAGVQSTALYMMNATEDPRLGEALPDGRFAEIAIFSDPGDEGRDTYAHLWRLAEWGHSRLPIHITRASHPGTTGTLAGDLETDRFASIPAFTRKVRTGMPAMLRRQCTRQYKISPIHKILRKRAGIKPNFKMRAEVRQQVGISLDEVVRMKPSREKWETRLYPLIEMKWRRIDCLRYLEENWPHPVAKSSCVFCPFKSNNQWRDLKSNHPIDWERACEVDELIRDLHFGKEDGVQEQMYIHPSMEPLRTAYLDEDQLDLFGEFAGECEGMCGV